MTDVLEFTDRFHELEGRLGLFERHIGGIRWWDIVRYEVNVTAWQRLCGAVDAAQPARCLATRIGNRLAREAGRAAFLLRSQRQYDTLVIRAARQRLESRAVDPAVDPFVELTEGRHLTVDTFPHLVHRHGSRRRAGVSTPDGLDRLTRSLSEGLGVELPAITLDEIVERRLSEFYQEFDDYQRLLERVQPRLVVMTQNGLEKGLFAAASVAGIPVLETQHGLIGHGHPNYAYPSFIEPGSLPTLPTVFAAFSDYWIRSCHYPALRCVALGNDTFYLPALPLTGPGEVMFVSADIYHSVLAPRVRSLALKLPGRSIVYKLHPNQFDHSAAIRNEFSDLPNVHVVGGEVSARQLLATTSIVVVVQSTVAHEALQCGRRLCIVPEMNYLIHEDLIALPGVAVTADTAALAAQVEAGPPSAIPPQFFAPFDRPRARLLMAELSAAPPQSTTPQSARVRGQSEGVLR